MTGLLWSGGPLTDLIPSGNSTVVKGVTYKNVDTGVIVTVEARHEVILAAGAYFTPQILMLSGVGPAAELAKHNIKPRLIQERVGSEIMVRPVYFAGWTGTQLFPEQDPDYYLSEPVWAEYLQNGTGALAMTQAGVVGTLLLPETNNTVLFGYSGVNTPAPGLPLSYHIAYTYNVKPKSTSKVELYSTDPAEFPKMTYGFLQVQDDLDTLVEAAKLTRKIANTQPFAAHQGFEFLPGAGVDTDEEIAENIRMFGLTAFHAWSSTRMGKGTR